MIDVWVVRLGLTSEIESPLGPGSIRAPALGAFVVVVALFFYFSVDGVLVLIRLFLFNQIILLFIRSGWVEIECSTFLALRF